MDKIINYLLLIIIFVFDPLAIALVIAANFAFEQLGNKYKENIYGEKVLNEPIEEKQEKQEISTPPVELYSNIDENLEKEFDEDHALDEVLNDMALDLEEEIAGRQVNVNDKAFEEPPQTSNESSRLDQHKIMREKQKGNIDSDGNLIITY
tara:strand:- start:2438 stop:2890 length:453 start_codon:yes stop_codon:yes gene_type:complete